MIKFADENTREDIRRMWKTCFGDSDEYINIHFSRKYKDENTLIAIKGFPVASLQILPYNITFYKELIPFSYISGANTLPEFRKQGYMERLLLHSFKVMQDRNIPLSILIPAESWLFQFYQKYGYSQCFEKGITPAKIKDILDKNNFNINESYREFHSIYSRLDFCVQKSKYDFETIILENELENYPEEQNEAAMVRIIDAKKTLVIFAKNNYQKSFTLKVKDTIISQNNKTFRIEKGNCTETTSSPDFSVSINLLAQLLFGFKMESVSEPYNSLFEPHHPIINLMY